MKKIFFKIFRLAGWLAGLVLLYIAGVLLYGTVYDFQPEGTIALPVEGSADQQIISDSILTFTTWNVGYGGLGAKANFFYDSGSMFFSNGKMIRSEEDDVNNYVAGIEAFARRDSSDFLLLQEVDYRSKRSYYINQFEWLGKVLPGYASVFAVNYKANWVPLPIFEPWRAYGATNSGLGSWSKFQPESSDRVQLPGSFAWPTRIFQLDRCAAVQRFKITGGKELVVVNVHNSAYDKGGELKAAQMGFLKKLFLEEYEKGHYVIVGGDWNQCPPGFPFDKFMPGNTSGYTQTNIDQGFLPSDWTWCFDANTPTNRKVREVYKQGETFVTLIDFFLVSPNVQLLKVQTENLNFLYSDHQPVSMNVKLR